MCTKCGTIDIDIDKFPYLGSVKSNSANIDDEISLHVAKANASFGRLRYPV